MKKLILAIVIISSLSCTKEKSQSFQLKILNEKSEKIILNDIVFQEYVKATVNVLNNGVNISKLQKLMKLKDLTVENKLDFAIAMGYNSIAEFDNYAKVQAQRLGYLRKLYDINSYKQEDLHKFFVKGINKTNNTTKILTFNSKKVSVVDGDNGESVDPQCGRRLSGCLVGALATAIIGHAACAATDWVTLGVSAYFCHGGVILLQASMSDGCNLDFQECHNKKTKDNIAD